MFICVAYSPAYICSYCVHTFGGSLDQPFSIGLSLTKQVLAIGAEPATKAREQAPNTASQQPSKIIASPCELEKQCNGNVISPGVKDETQH